MAGVTETHVDEEIQRHLALVQLTDLSINSVNGSAGDSYRLQPVATAPIFSRKIKERLNSSDNRKPAFPIYGHLGLRLATYRDRVEAQELQAEENLVYANVNAPSSTFICGSQGAGKSHTLSCLLENALLSDGHLGPNPNPLAGILFHYDKYSGQAAAQICEAAYLASKAIEVEVFVSPSNIWAMQKLYKLPGIPAEKQPTVRPLLFRDSQVNIDNIGALMNIDGGDGKLPLYMAVVNKILRQMAIERQGAPGIDYNWFRRELNGAKLTPSQTEHLEMRLQLLESFLYRAATSEFKQLAGHGFNPKAGSLTIVDLSCPFVHEGDACMLFSICLSLFLGSRSNHGLLIALDEAHKFLTETGEAKTFTEDLLQVIRQQRHFAARVVVATQEPTLSPTLLDFCNVTIVHRFHSHAWYSVLKSHLAALSSRNEDEEVFRRIVNLENGEALMFCPTAYLDADDPFDIAALQPLRSGYIKLRVRKRLTEDGGKGIMATECGSGS